MAKEFYGLVAQYEIDVIGQAENFLLKQSQVIVGISNYHFCIFNLI